ncbi:MAG: FAD-dependent oxidoreductase, partial [Chloroflexota bacterium]
MTRKQIVIVGASFAGYTAALELYEKLGNRHDITVIDRKTHFLFMPSLIWYPFGLREEEDISYDVRPAFEQRGINFIQTEATRFDLENKRVETLDGDVAYDFLVVATGPKPDYDYIPGVKQFSQSILGIGAAEKAREAWENLLEDPGPVVVVAPQGAACFGAAYEFLFNARHQAGKNKLANEIKFTYISAEPFPSHFGIGGFANGEFLTKAFFKLFDIDSRFNTGVQEVCPDGVRLSDGEFLPSKYTMVMPRFLGVDAVRNSPGLANAGGWIEVDDGYRHPVYP